MYKRQPLKDIESMARKNLLKTIGYGKMKKLMSNPAFTQEMTSYFQTSTEISSEEKAIFTENLNTLPAEMLNMEISYEYYSDLSISSELNPPGFSTELTQGNNIPAVEHSLDSAGPVGLGMGGGLDYGGLTGLGIGPDAMEQLKSKFFGADFESVDQEMFLEIAQEMGVSNLGQLGMQMQNPEALGFGSAGLTAADNISLGGGKIQPFASEKIKSLEKGLTSKMMNIIGDDKFTKGIFQAVTNMSKVDPKFLLNTVGLDIKTLNNFEFPGNMVNEFLLGKQVSTDDLFSIDFEAPVFDLPLIEGDHDDPVVAIDEVMEQVKDAIIDSLVGVCLLYTSPSPRD